jgi:hypothetical protein
MLTIVNIDTQQDNKCMYKTLQKDHIGLHLHTSEAKRPPPSNSAINPPNPARQYSALLHVRGKALETTD